MIGRDSTGARRSRPCDRRAPCRCRRPLDFAIREPWHRRVDWFLVSGSVFFLMMGGLVGWAALAAWMLLDSLYLQGTVLAVSFWGAGALIGKWALEGLWVPPTGKERR